MKLEIIARQDPTLYRAIMRGEPAPPPPPVDWSYVRDMALCALLVALAVVKLARGLGLL